MSTSNQNVHPGNVKKFLCWTISQRNLSETQILYSNLNWWLANRGVCIGNDTYYSGENIFLRILRRVLWSSRRAQPQHPDHNACYGAECTNIPCCVHWKCDILNVQLVSNSISIILPWLIFWHKQQLYLEDWLSSRWKFVHFTCQWNQFRIHHFCIESILAVEKSASTTKNDKNPHFDPIWMAWPIILCWIFV